MTNPEDNVDGGIYKIEINLIFKTGVAITKFQGSNCPNQAIEFTKELLYEALKNANIGTPDRSALFDVELLDTDVKTLKQGASEKCPFPSRQHITARIEDDGYLPGQSKAVKFMNDGLIIAKGKMPEASDTGDLVDEDQVQLTDHEGEYTLEEWRDISKEMDERISRLHEKAYRYLKELMECNPGITLRTIDLETAEKWDEFFKGLDAIENNQRHIKAIKGLIDQQWKDHHEMFPVEAPLHQAGDKDLVEHEIKNCSILLKGSLEDIMMICLEKKNGLCEGIDCSAMIPHQKTYKCQNCCDKSHCVPVDAVEEAPTSPQDGDQDQVDVEDLQGEDVQQPAPEDLQEGDVE